MQNRRQSGRALPLLAAGAVLIGAAGPAHRGAMHQATRIARDTVPGVDTAHPPVNTGVLTPTNPKDTVARRPTGAGHSVSGVGTGVASLGGASSGSDQTATGAFPGNMLNNLGSDAYIISAVDVVNTDEIAEGMLARQRGVSPRVRMFAQRMVTEHTTLQARDRAVAQNPRFIAGDSAQVTRQMAAADRANLLRLQQTPAGPAFDGVYITQQVQDHRNALALLEAARKQARDGQVKDLISASIPIVQRHLRMAERVQATLGLRR